MVMPISDGDERAAVPVIRAISVPGRENAKRTVSILFLAWIGSLIIHGGLLTLLLIVKINVSRANAAPETEIIQTLVDEDKKDANLTNDHESLNPDPLLHYHLPRIEANAV